jgi:hypothetical protein
MDISVDKLDALAGPYEILELAPGQRQELRVERWQVGKATINPRDGRPAKPIAVLRLFVPATVKPTLPHYWDITQANTVAGLIPYLEAHDLTKTMFVLTRQGVGAKSRHTVEVRPA